MITSNKIGDAIDWSNPDSKISKYFTVKDACYLPSWKVMHTPTEREKSKILATATSMDKVRELLGKPIKVHCWLRPIKADCPTPPVPHPVDLNYNKLVGSSPSSGHVTGIAVDWSCGEPCDKTRAFLFPKLEELGARMEDLVGSSWVHLDWKPLVAGRSRFFRP